MSQLQGCCLEFLHTGQCHAPTSCKLKHHLRLCAPCTVVCSPGRVYEDHLKGRRHREKITATAIASALIWLQCPTCNILVAGEVNWGLHVQLPTHQMIALSQLRSPYEYPLDPCMPGSYYCLLCKKSVPLLMAIIHPHGDFHQKMEKAAYHRSQLEQAEQDRRGVMVSHSEQGVDFGVTDLEMARKGVQIEVNVRTPPNTYIVQVHTQCDRFARTNP